MATWQFDSYLIPTSEAQPLLVESDPSRRRELFEEMSFWCRSQPPADYDSRLDTFLEETTSWSARRRMWGSDDGNRVEVCFEENRIVEVHLRVDMRNLDGGFLAGIVRFADECDAMFLTGNMELSLPELDWLVAAAVSSTSGSFAADPERFLEDLDRRRRAGGE